jgi:hypothetical protein
VAESVSYLLPDPPLAAPPAPPPAGEPVHDTAMVARAQGRLITHYRQPRNLALLAGFVDEVQEAEDSAAVLYVDLRLPDAAGEALDFLGRIVGEKRAGRVDDDYRGAIATRILVSRSKGRIEDLIAVAVSLVPTATVQVAEYWPPALSFSLSTLGAITFDTAFRMLRQAKAAGVRLELTYGAGTLGSDDDTYLGGIMGSDDDTTLGFEMASTA